MDHHPYFRNRPDGDSAVLLIHGILSTPRHFDWLIPHIPDQYAVSNILLAGHGGTVKDFSKATMAQWQAQVENALNTLEEKYSNVYVIGHSLGSLLALQAAKTHKGICGLLLLNVPLIPRLKLSMVGRSFRFAFGKVRADDPVDIQCYNDLGVGLHPYLWKYLCWIPNFLSLLKLARKCRPLPAELAIPCYAYFAGEDELVHPNSCRYFQCNPEISLALFQHGTHFGYDTEEQASILRGLNTLFTKHNNTPNQS